jgi:hypothetical protein
MTLTRIHTFAWVAAALTAAFVLELSGAFRVGAAGIFVPFILILLTGFFSVRWFAGFLAFLLIILSFLVAPFWVLETGAVALTALLLLIAAPFLTGNRFPDFLILLAVGACVVAILGAWVHGGGFSPGAVFLSLVMNLVVGGGAFALLERSLERPRPFAL